MSEKITRVLLNENDYALLRDIHEFYYVDFYNLHLSFWNQYEDHVTARKVINRRLKTLVNADLIQSIPFFSERRTNSRGHASYAYTLTRTGLNTLSDKLGRELDWNTSQKERKSLYIQHHLNILFYCTLYYNEVKKGRLVDYFGEQSSRFQIIQNQLPQDFVKPDAILIWKVSNRYFVPWLIEYERNSRASKSTIEKKLSNHSDYAKKGMYKQHEILDDNDAKNYPVFVLYCENQHVVNRRIRVIREQLINFYDYNKFTGYGEVLYGLSENIENDPMGKVYKRISGEEVTVNHVNFVQKWVHLSLTKKRNDLAADLTYSYIPPYLASRDNLHWDGIIQLQSKEFSTSYLLQYYSKDTSDIDIQKEIHSWQSAIQHHRFTQHPVLKRNYQMNNRPSILIVVDTIEQEKFILKQSSLLDLQNELSKILITRSELIEDPYGAIWLQHGKDNRVKP